VAFGEHAIDVANRVSAVARRTARPERRSEPQVRHFLTPRPPANETPRLTRQIFQRQLDRIEPQEEAAGVDAAIIGRRSGSGGWRRRP
jgi:hypothetical protein